MTMIKTLIKHAIYDHAINILFDQVYDNFIKPQMSISERIFIEFNRLQAESRQIDSNWTLGAESDVQAYHGLDIEEELTRMMENEI